MTRIPLLHLRRAVLRSPNSGLSGIPGTPFAVRERSDKSAVSSRFLYSTSKVRQGSLQGLDEASSPSSSKGESDKAKRDRIEDANEIERRRGVLKQIHDVMTQKRSELEPRIKQQLEELGRRWNAYSGYEEVLEAKALVLEAEVELKALQERQAVLRQEYVDAVAQRAQSQRTLNELLTRKPTWNDDDLSRYTELLRSEHSDAQNERETTERFETMGNRLNAAWDDVVRKTLDRYHKEQIWSDRVRAGSTYGSFLIAGVNVFIFILAFVVVEPYKRKRLAQTFESRLLQGEEINAQMLARVVQDFQAHVASLEEHDEATNKSLRLLLLKAGVQAGGDEDGEHSLSGKRIDAATNAATASPSQQQLQQQQHTPSSSSGEKRRDLAMAGALGFAAGAGLLAAFGALHS